MNNKVNLLDGLELLGAIIIFLLFALTGGAVEEGQPLVYGQLFGCMCFMMSFMQLIFTLFNSLRRKLAKYKVSVFIISVAIAISCSVVSIKINLNKSLEFLGAMCLVLINYWILFNENKINESIIIGKINSLFEKDK